MIILIYLGIAGSTTIRAEALIICKIDTIRPELDVSQAKTL